MSEPNDGNPPWGDDFKSWFENNGGPEQEPDDREDVPPDEQKPQSIPIVTAMSEVNFLAGLRVLRPREGAYVVCDIEGKRGENIVPINFRQGKRPGVTDSAMLVITLDHLSTSKDPDVRKAIEHLQQAARWLFVYNARQQLLEG